MKYQLALFDRLLDTEWNTTCCTDEKLERFRGFLKQSFGPCLKFYDFQFEEKPNGKYTLVFSKNSGLFDPDYIKVPKSNDTKIDKKLLESFLEKCLTYMQIPRENIISATYIKENNKLSFYATAEFEYEAISNEDIAYCYYRTNILQEIKKIKQSIKSQVFRLKSKGDIVLYIQKHQECIANMSKLIIEKLGEKKEEKLYHIFAKNSLLDSLLKLLYNNLEKVLEYIEKDYAKYIDLSSPVIYGQRVTVSMEIKNKLESVMQCLKAGVLSDCIIEIVEDPLKRLSGLKEDDKITYRDLKYLRQLLDECFETFNKSEHNDANLAEVLLNLNYNTIGFFSYIVNEIIIDTNNIESIEFKREKLYLWLKKYLQCISKPGMIYISDYPAIKEQIVCWLREEIDYLEIKINFNLPSHIENTGRTGSKAKIEVSLSVAQLSYFIKLFSQTRVIINRNQSDVFRVISEVVATQKAKDISPESLGSKYYNIELTTKHAVKDLVIKMLNAINREQ